MARFSLLSLIFAVGAAAQATSFTDSNTGITFQSYQDSDTECRFGIALPETLETDFIGQIVRKHQSRADGRT